MDAKKCDACGKFYERYGRKISKYNTIFARAYSTAGFEQESEKFDLCPECMEKVLTVLKGGRE